LHSPQHEHDVAKKAQTQTGTRALRAVFDDASRRNAEAAELTAASPDPNLPRAGMRPGKWPGFPSDNMPPPETGNRVQVVGRDADGLVYAISTTGHLRRLERFDMQALNDLYAPDTNTLKFCWPAYGKAKETTDPDTGDIVKVPRVERVEKDKVMECLINEAARHPDFDPNLHHRGRGGWEDGHGNFLWHSGSWLWSAENGRLTRARPQQHDGHLYTRAAGTIEPWAQPVSQAESPARRILEDLRTWNWQRPYLDPLLVMGWIATAIMGGALKARPIVFTSGGAGVGKSRLHELVRGALDRVVITSVNTTAAGIYQRVKQDSLPIMVDELESKAGSTRAENVIELARVAYTGGDISRGGADHEATTFTARNSFFFSAIIPPPMGPQDKTRMAMLNLGPLDRDRTGRDMVLKPDTDGRMLLRQVMDGWRDFSTRALADYAQVLNGAGLSARAIDTYGTLLAAAEMLVGADVLEDVGLPVTDDRRLGEIIAAATASDRTEAMEHWHKALDILYSSTIEGWRDGVKPTIGGVLEDFREAAARAPDGQGLLDALKTARERLQLVNLGVAGPRWGGPNAGPVLAVPADGPMLKRIYADTEFQKGGWNQALKQAPRGIVLEAKKIKISGATKHCLLVDLDAFEAWTAKP
jgi:hypothetical protein